jgi:hypothetical protein
VHVIYHKESVAHLPDPEVEVEPVAVARVPSPTSTVSPAVETATNPSNRSSHTTHKPLASMITYHRLPGNQNKLFPVYYKKEKFRCLVTSSFMLSGSVNKKLIVLNSVESYKPKSSRLIQKVPIWAKAEEERKRD